SDVAPAPRIGTPPDTLRADDAATADDEPTQARAPAHRAFPSLPPLIPLPEPLAAASPVLPPPRAEVPTEPPETVPSPDLPIVDTPLADEVTARVAPSQAMTVPPAVKAESSMARAVHGAHYDAAYTVPQVPETLRRFDAVASSDSFAGSVETAARAPDPPDHPTPPTLDAAVPDVRFDPKAQATQSRGGVPWVAIGGLLLFALGVVAVLLTVLGPPELGLPEPEEDPGLGPLQPAAAAPVAPAAEMPEVSVQPAPARLRSRPTAAIAPLATRTAAEPDPTPEPAAEPAEPAEPVAVTGMLRIRSNKRALVKIDDESVGLTPSGLAAFEIELSAGPHTIEVMQPGQRDTRQIRTTEIEAGGEQTVRFTF
ncbi:MAG: hypothetical protein AAF211_21365, partial [Myxococcota bacterium]